MLSTSIKPRKQATRLEGSYALLVDDHEPSLRRLREIVEMAGHRCVAVSSATSAQHTCAARQPRVVVTDLTMPNLDGCALARWMQDRCPDLPIILVTGKPIDSTALSSLRRTFAAVFSKPIEIEPFLDCLERLMTSRSE